MYGQLAKRITGQIHIVTHMAVPANFLYTMTFVRDERIGNKIGEAFHTL